MCELVPITAPNQQPSELLPSSLLAVGTIAREIRVNEEQRLRAPTIGAIFAAPIFAPNLICEVNVKWTH